MQKFKGIVPPVFTTFKSNEEIDEDSFSSLVKFLIDAGVHALWIEGSAGEFSSLSVEERKRIYELSIEEAKGKVPIIAGVSHSSTKVAVELAKYAETAGADAVQATAPYYFYSSQSSLFNHYKAISEAVDIPIVIYDNVGSTKHTITPDLIAKMKRELGIHSIKICLYPHQTPLEKAMKLKKLMGDDINILVASCQYAYYAFLEGVADGTISAPLNVIPNEFVKMYEAIQSGDNATAREIQYNKILPLTFLSFSLVKEETSYIQVGKLILKWRGVIQNETVRKPLSPLKDWHVKNLKDVVEYTKLIP